MPKAARPLAPRRAKTDPLRATFVARATKAVEAWGRSLSARDLATAVAEPRDELVVLRALQHPEAWAEVLGTDPLAAARARGVDRQKDLLAAEGGVLGVEDVAKALGITRQAVDKRRRLGRLLALPRGGNRWVFPAWQLGRRRALEGLEDVLAVLGEHDPWSKLMFFLTPNRLLRDRTPLDALRSSDAAAVARAAKGYGEQGLA